MTGSEVGTKAETGVGSVKGDTLVKVGLDTGVGIDTVTADIAVLIEMGKDPLVETMKDRGSGHVGAEVERDPGVIVEGEAGIETLNGGMKEDATVIGPRGGIPRPIPTDQEKDRTPTDTPMKVLIQEMAILFW